MPSLDLYKSIHNAPNYNGLRRKVQADSIENATWWEDIDARVVYLYDFYHDNEPTKLRGLNPEESDDKIPVDAKYIQSAHQTMSKDQVAFHLQLRPGQECNVDYYDEFFAERYDAFWPVGLYVDIPDNNNQYNKWLVVATADFYSPQFSTFEILPCDYVLQWMIKGRKMEMAGVLQSQNSYNSGLWRDYIIESVQDQQKIILPMNRDTEKIYYNQRLIIDNNVITEPRTWQVSKVNRINSNGVVLITTAQTDFDPHRDYIEKDKDGNVVGMWADFFDSGYIPQDIPSPNQEVPTISFSGIKPEIKIKGNYKKLTVDDEGNGEWKFYIAETEVPELIAVLTSSDSDDVEDNQIKIKFKGGNEYLGDVLTVVYIKDGNQSTLRLDIVSL